MREENFKTRKYTEFFLFCYLLMKYFSIYILYGKNQLYMLKDAYFTINSATLLEFKEQL